MLFVFIVNNIFLFRFILTQTPYTLIAPSTSNLYIQHISLAITFIYITGKETETYFMMLKDNVPKFSGADKLDYWFLLLFLLLSICRSWRCLGRQAGQSKRKREREDVFLYFTSIFRVFIYLFLRKCTVAIILFV